MSDARPLLLLDFDGVLNFDASRNAYKNNPAVPHHWHQTRLHADGMDYRVRYSWEVVRSLNEMRATHDFEWLWLSTWKQWGPASIRPRLRTLDDGYIDWTEADGQGYPGYHADDRAAAKLAHVERINDEDARPFVWVDDEAVRWLDRTRLRHPDVPHLVIQTDPMWGLTTSDLSDINDFYASLA